MPKQELKLRDLKELLDKAVVGLPDDSNPRVEIWFGDTLLRAVSVGQFSIVPDVTIHVRHD